MELMEAIRSRVSARSYLDTPVPDFVINEMLTAASLSPSGGNAQSYRFGVVRDAALKQSLAHAAGEQMWISKAPVVIACCADISWDLRDQPVDDFGRIVNELRFGADFIRYTNAYPDRARVNELYQNATPLIASEHMALTAVSHGLSSCFIGYLDVERASQILNLPPHIKCLFLLCVGYADQPTPHPEKLTGREIAFFDLWKEPK